MISDFCEPAGECSYVQETPRLSPFQRLRLAVNRSAFRKLRRYFDEGNERQSMETCLSKARKHCILCFLCAKLRSEMRGRKFKFHSDRKR